MDKVISLKDLTICHSKSSKHADSADIVLTNINFEVEKGELVYLIGKVGSGKSTLLKALYGEVPIMQGEGMVAGYNLRSLSSSVIPYLRRRLGIVFQDFQLLPDRNVYDNLAFVLKATGWKKESEMQERIGQILELVNLTHKAYKKPHHLSGGEQQRLTIGRSFINHPEIILADEPTGNLDPSTTEDIMKLFMDITAMGTSVIIATHDISIIEHHPSRTMAFEA
ncbi:MAG: ATP-binding cassette domain-containing protein, partial [Rikenellaceae bacterium]